MAKPRVYELAKELGVESKTVVAKLQEMGEFVRSASSTVEAPVVRRLRDAFAGQAGGAKTDGKPAAGKKRTPGPARSGRTPAPGPRRSTAPGAPHPGPHHVPEPHPAAESRPAPAARPEPSAPAAHQGPRPGSRPAPHPERDHGEHRPSEHPRRHEGAPHPAPHAGGPRPGNNPFAPSQGMPRGGRSGAPRPGGPRPGPRPGGPRPGNNPFAASQGMPRPQRPGDRRSAPGHGGPRPGAPRPGAPRPGGPRPGGPRPNPGMMPKSSGVGRPGAPSHGRGGGRGRSGFGGPGGGPHGHGPGGGGRPGGFGGRGGRRGGTQGAFGRGGGKVRGRKSKRQKRQDYEAMQAPSLGGVQVPRGNGSTELRLRRGATLADFGEKIGANPASLVTVLFHLGEMATATQSLDEDTFTLLGDELGYKIQIVSPEDEDREILESFDIDLDAEESDEDDADLVPRPPVVTVMGHVDHGKTKLLDAIRHTHVVEGEAGGITQHIGAYQVVTELEGEKRPVTFIDTPGHEAFTAMRARGAESTDIAILVVAADDGVMPQTVEALNHAKAAGVPIVVAVNKIDKEGANPAKIRSQLTEYGLVAEEYGGDTMFVDVSAKQRTGIDELLSAVLLTADASLDLRANPNKDARGVAIEAKLDKGRGAVATVLVQSGTLHVGDTIVAGTAHGRVRAMLDENGKPLEAAPPARPVQVLGLTSVPQAGDSFIVTPDDRTARQIAEKREAAERNAQLAKARKRITLEDFTKALEEGKVETLSLIIKGDVAGSVEALEDALLKIDVGDEVDLQVIHRGVGAITQNDVNLATVDNAIIIGFNVRYAERVEDLADREGVDVRFYSVIYDAIDDVESALKGMLKPVYEEVKLGSAEIREVFRSSKFGNIAGAIVRDGVIRRGAKARLLRDGNVVAENLSIDSLRRFKDDATEVREGFECGIGLGSYNDIKEGDVIDTYEMKEKPRD